MNFGEQKLPLLPGLHLFSRLLCVTVKGAGLGTRLGKNPISGKDTSTGRILTAPPLESNGSDCGFVKSALYAQEVDNKSSLDMMF